MVSPAPARAAPPRVPLIPRAETVGPLAQGQPARPPQTLPPALTQSQRPAPTTPPPRAQREPSRDRLSISTSPLPLGSSGATLTPRLNLATSLGDSRRQPALSENAMSLLRQKQARLRAAPAGEDLPSLEAELVVLQKRTAEMQRQLDSVMSQMAAMRAASGAGGSSSAGTATAPAKSVPLSPTIATAPVVASAPAAPARPADTESPIARIPSATESDASWMSFINDSRVLIAGPLLLVIALLILGFVLWLRRERDDARRAERWNLTPYAGSPIAVPGVSPPTPRTSFEDEVPLPPSTAQGPITQRGTAPDTRRGPDAYQFTTYSSGQDAQELGVSDLAQATEKASVFVTLGRPAQAIDVLRDHIDHEPKSSPMAWLMLLDLYRQTARNEDFNDIAERFHLEFNAVTPEWAHAIAPLHDAGLAAFPYLVARIREDWPGVKARNFIEDLLYDNRGGSRIGFSIPAFRDLLTLHSMIEEHLVALDKHGRIDPDTGHIIEAPLIPEPPAHLSSIWATASPERPAYTSPPPGLPGMAAPAKATLAFDMGSIAGSMDRSALEKSYPIIVEALVSRWGKSGLAAYLSNLIRSSADRGAGLNNDALSEMILLHDIALDLGEPEPTFSIS